MIIPEFQRPSLSPEQLEALSTLAKTLTPDQALWVSGYFAGIEYGARNRTEGGREVFGQLGSDAGPEPKSEATSRTVTVLYGSETGNSAQLARSIAEQGQALGLKISAADMADYKLRRLKDEQDVLIVTSTYGEGDPPQPAVGFFEFIESRKAPKLSGLRYAVLALGDSTYERYCEAGKRLDRRMEELGAARLHARVDCDVDYEEPAAGWIATVLARLAEEDRSNAEAAARAPVRLASETRAAPSEAGFDKRNPFSAPIIENLVLTGRGSSKETRHIELSLEGSGLRYEPGDALGFVPRNDPGLVEAVIEALALDPAVPIVHKGLTRPLLEALETTFEITTATPRFLRHWAEITGSAELEGLLADENATERAAFVRKHHVIDIARRFRAPGLSAELFVAGLRSLQPRLYSIASSLAGAPEEAHLTVATVRYALHGEERSGVASGHLAERAGSDTTLPVYIQSNPHFRLPADDIPIIMVGAGTGVAPFRGFMQERQARAAAGRSWLFFGERNFRTDFLYQTEWQRLLKDGSLTRMDVAFSRDRTEKAYVQHRMREQARELFGWLEDGAHFYVCGDAERLAPDVNDALRALIEQQGGLGRDAAEDYLRALQRDGRYQRDVY